MNTPKDGGPAFPFTPTDRSGQIAETQPGMSLRDYFAAKALQGMIGTCTTEKAVANLVPACWLIADAMLAQRETHK